MINRLLRADIDDLKLFSHLFPSRFEEACNSGMDRKTFNTWAISDFFPTFSAPTNIIIIYYGKGESRNNYIPALCPWIKTYLTSNEP